jgi:hypothetical protein
MRSEGRRQDVAYLALAVAVLAIALALFVGMRSAKKRQPEEPKEEPVVQVEPEADVDEEPPETDGRDPFKVQGGSKGGPAAGAAVAAHELKLVGVVMERGGQPMAIIRSAKGRHYARVGDRVGGYTVVSVGANEAMLSREGDRLTLVLREPVAEE